jgi:hypothetical protein
MRVQNLLLLLLLLLILYTYFKIIYTLVEDATLILF